MFWIKLRMCRRTHQDENLEFTVFLAKRAGRETVYRSEPRVLRAFCKRKGPYK